MTIPHNSSFAETGSLESSSGDENIGSTASSSRDEAECKTDIRKEVSCSAENLRSGAAIAEEANTENEIINEAPETTNQNVVPKPLFPAWTRLTEMMHRAIKSTVVQCALHAARHPRTYVGVITFLSFFLIAVGYFTNFTLELDFEKVFAPMHSMPANVSCPNKESVTSECKRTTKLLN